MSDYGQLAEVEMKRTELSSERWKEGPRRMNGKSFG